ncbi:MAG: SRPBCC domain-containing protein [Bacteriovoracia bacterium]
MPFFNASVSVQIKAPIKKVWEHITKPELVKKYFFGVDIETDWKKNSAIYFRGEWQGNKFEDKGKILDIQENKHLSFLYWSSFLGKPDSLESYQKVTYDLIEKNGVTTVTIAQECENKDHCEQNWKMVLEGLKKLCE